MKTSRPPAACRSGFSLVEVMVVIVIISLLATFVATNAMGKLASARRATASVDIAAICSALDAYAIHNGGRYPDSLEELVTPDVNGETYLKDMRSIPIDPWGVPYVYEPPGPSAREYRVAALGEDGEPGGEGPYADLDNFTIRERARRR